MASNRPTGDEGGRDGQGTDDGPALFHGMEFLVDAVILLRYVELEGKMGKTINVLKFRGGDHDRSYRNLQLTDRGMAIESSFEGIENISGGSARRSMSERAKELI